MSKCLRPRITLRFIWLLIFSSFAFFISCGDDRVPVAVDPHAPKISAILFPPSGSTEQSLIMTLSWSATDPDNDSLVYDLYFGTNTSPPLLANGISDTGYKVSILSPSTEYFWRIIATDPSGRSSNSRIWHFTTWDSNMYPLNIGNRWEYDGFLTIFNVRPDSLAGRFEYTLNQSTVVLIGGIDTLLETIETYRFDETLQQLDRTFKSSHYMNNLEDGFYNFGYTGSVSVGGTPIASAQSPAVKFNGRSFSTIEVLFDLVGDRVRISSTASEGIIYEIPPVRSLKYPLKEESEWNYKGPPNVWPINKRIIAVKKIEVPAGKFTCYEIQWLHDIDQDGQWDQEVEFFDYISDAGLVKRSITIRDIVLQDFTSRNLGLVDSKTEFVLTNLELR